MLWIALVASLVALFASIYKLVSVKQRNKKYNEV